jgi:hypothetical protein
MDQARRGFSADFVLLGALMIGCLLVPTQGHAQPITEAELALINRSLAARIETSVILAGDYALNAGRYKTSGTNPEDLRIIKGGREGAVTQPRGIGSRGVIWAPILIVNGGYFKSDRDLRVTSLAGNGTETKTYAFEAGAGARFKVTKIMSITPKLGLIYGRTKQEFVARNQAGEDAEALFGEDLLNWTLNSMTLTPGLEVKLDWNIGRADLQLITDYRFFHTWSFGESNPSISLDDDSHILATSIDMEVPLGLKLWGRELSAGTMYSRTELFGDIEEAFETGGANAIRARFAIETNKRLKHARWIGVGGSYFWASRLKGWSVGLDVRLDF